MGGEYSYDFQTRQKGYSEGQIWENIMARVTRRISFIFSFTAFIFFFSFTTKTYKERIYTKGVGWRLVREDWFQKVTNHHYCIIFLSLSLSLCSGNSMQSLGLAPLTFMKKVFLTAKIYSINWLQMGRTKLPCSCTKFLVTSRKAWYRGKMILSTSNFDLHLQFILQLKD